MMAFIDTHRDVYGVEPIVRLLPIASSTYHEHARRVRDPEKAPGRRKRDAELSREILRIHAENFGVYGRRKVWRQMLRDGTKVARCTVARLMRQLGLKGVVRGKAVKTTVPDKAAVCPLDKVQRQFRAPAPNRLWLSDFTYVSTWQGFAYVAFIIDAFPSIAIPPAAQAEPWATPPGGLSAGGSRAMPEPILCSTRLSRHCMRDSPSTGAALFITPTADLNTSVFAIPSAWLKRASNLLSAALEIRMIMLSQKR